MSETFEVRDMRHKEKFFVDDAYLNGYAKYLGTTTSMVYFVLCRHADKNQECFPSYDTIAEKLGVSDATVKRSIKTLKEWNIICIAKRKRKDGKFLHNSYTLLDKSVWQNKPEVTDDPRSPEVTGAQIQRSLVHKTIGHPRPIKDTHIKDTHIKDSAEASSAGSIVRVIDSFVEVNPSYKKWYGNKTQRSAVLRLIKEYGEEKLIKVVEILKTTNTKKYFPTITTPLELEDRWAKLESAFKRLKEEKEVSKINIY